MKRANHAKEKEALKLFGQASKKVSGLLKRGVVTQAFVGGIANAVATVTPPAGIQFDNEPPAKAKKPAKKVSK